MSPARARTPDAMPRRRASGATWPRCRTRPVPARPASLTIRRAVRRLVEFFASRMRPSFGSKALSAMAVVPRNSSDLQWKCFGGSEFQDAQITSLFLNDLEWRLRRGAPCCAIRVEQYQRLTCPTAQPFYLDILQNSPASHKPPKPNFWATRVSGL